MKVVVQDANILIDLEKAGILDLWFQLGHETHTTDQITRELRGDGSKGALAYIRRKVIKERKFTFEELAEIGTLREKCGGGTSFEDCSVLYLACEIGACVLTGDGPLRRQSEARSIEVHGMIWIFDELVAACLLAPAIAADKLRGLLDSGSYLPQSICDQRVQHWLRMSK